MKATEKQKKAAFIATNFLAKCFNGELGALSLILSAYDVIKASPDWNEDASNVLASALTDTRDFIQELLDDLGDEKES